MLCIKNVRYFKFVINYDKYELCVFNTKRTLINLKRVFFPLKQGLALRTIVTLVIIT